MRTPIELTLRMRTRDQAAKRLAGMNINVETGQCTRLLRPDVCAAPPGYFMSSIQLGMTRNPH
jgi:hypothetical protein